MTRILLASRNAKKLAELRRILAPELPDIEVLGLGDVPAYAEVPETGATFAENALIKAREGFARTGLPTVADDSGLAVDALNGMPGVLSARWSGSHGDDESNLQLVLDQLSDTTEERRGAQFVCAVAFVDAGGRGRRRRCHARSPRPGAARREWLRLRPDLRRRPGTRRPTPSWNRPRRTPSAIVGRRCARSSRTWRGGPAWGGTA